ncbi:MAG: hypothetical protein P2A85_09320 [Microcoleus anatoxicus]|uniref:hypothetical protein n=1 Tax=Microcoleus anatoxicus TaxID=2705319 RepID=UPI00366E475B
MSEENNQDKREMQPMSSGSSEEYKDARNWWIEIVSLIAMVYLIFSLISPMYFEEKRQPRKIEAPDIILIALVFLFNSGLLNRLEDLGISKDGGVTAKFKQLKQEVNEQKKRIYELQAKQLEQLEKQQNNLEETQAFMYNFLLGDKDYEKIDQLYRHSETKTNYNFYVSDRVGDELRRLRDLKLITTKSGYISDLVRASDYGKRSINLTEYLDVTDLGKKFLVTRETLQSKNQQETKKPGENPEVE